MDIMELSPTVRNELGAMAYARWSTAVDNLKKIKAATWESMDKFCPKSEWPNYHKTMIDSAETELLLAEDIKFAICKYSPLIAGK